MSDVNPYEPPKANDTPPARTEPPPSPPTTKRLVGAITILSLTPVAVGIAVWASCNASNNYIRATYHVKIHGWYAHHLLIGLMICGAPPLLTGLGMIRWAWRIYRKEVPNSQQ